jgi:hypothetical protein
MNKTSENNDWYEAPKPAGKQAAKWLGLIWQALFYSIFCGFFVATILALYNYIFPPPHQEILAADFEFYALLLNGLIGAIVGLIFGLIPTLSLLMLFNYGINIQKIWQLSIIGIIVPITILYGFDILLKAKMNGILPFSQYLIVIISGIVVGLFIFKPDLKPYFAPKPKAE